MRLLLFPLLLFAIPSAANDVYFANSVRADNLHCSVPGVAFKIKNSHVESFNAQTAIEDPDLARGYTLTCVHHIAQFSQTKNGNEYLLAFTEPNNQFGESLDCRVHIVETATSLHVYTTDCVSECMKFDHTLEKVGNIYRETK